MGKKTDHAEPPPYAQGDGEEQTESSEVDWERPPVYELRGSGENMSTSVVAQGV
jgi:hypothetical protein